MIKIICIMGKSGTGKSTVVKELCKDDRFHYVKSFTTRQPRPNDPEDINTHIFVDNKHYENNKGEILALYESPNGYKSYTTIESFDRDKKNIYVIDPKAFIELVELSETNLGTFDMFGIYLYLEDRVRLNRFKQRGDNTEFSLEEHLDLSILEDYYKTYHELPGIVYNIEDNTVEEIVETIKNHIIPKEN